MKRIVMDTNTLISAAGWQSGKERLILNRCINGDYRLVMSQEMFSELQKVLLRPKFDFISTETKQAIFLSLATYCEMVLPKRRITIIKTDKTDNRVLECAVEARADYIITGDEHLLSLKTFEGIRIIDATDFLAI